ncbi:hypothetical protein SLS60_004083 [Paraconiothyrium brasiliense]|uniref:Uncharacterized protein n=1 Tax=Paraconiothyrium brasiliense TaxID=300254 RepID=A0ABR3RQI7_9PLEO
MPGRCELKFCPFRTDLTEMMQRYYSTARLDERIEGEEMDVDHHTATVAGEVTEWESNETYEGESLIDSKSRSASGEVEDDGSGHDLLADTTLAPSSHTKDTVPSLVSVSPQPSSLQALKHSKPLMSQVSHIKADTGEEEHEKPNQLSVHANEEQLNADPMIPVPGQGFRKRSRKERRNRARRTKLLTELKTRVPQPVSVGTVATSRSPLTPSPPGLPQVSLPPATSISHAGSQRCKRKASGQGDSAHTEMRPAKKRRQRGKKQAEELSAMQRHDLARRAHRAQKRGAVPLKDRMTHPGPMGK